MNAIAVLDDVAQSLANIAELAHRGAESTPWSLEVVRTGRRVLLGLSADLPTLQRDLDSVEFQFAEQVDLIESDTAEVCECCGNVRPGRFMVDGFCATCNN